MKPASVADYRELARRRLPPMFFEYIDGGSYAEATLRRNVADMEAIALRQRVMRDMSQLDLSVEVFGEKLSMPVGLAPVGMAGMYARRGEAQAARAAAGAGIPFCLSTVGVCSVDAVTAAAGAPPWFQLYMLKDRGYMRDLLGRAKGLGQSPRGVETGLHRAQRRKAGGSATPSLAREVGFDPEPPGLGSWD